MDQATEVLNEALDASQTAAAEPLSNSPSGHRIPKLAPLLKTFAAIQIALVLACAAIEAFCKFVLHLTGPYIYPLKTRSQSCWDFILYAGKFQHFHQPGFFLTDPAVYFTYPAPAAVAYEIFFSFAHPLRLFVGFIVGSFVVAAILLGSALHRRGVSLFQASTFLAVSLLLAYPLGFELKQGNIEICSWVLVAIGVWAFAKDKPYVAAACFGLAGSMKIFPFVYLGLLLSARKFRELLFSVLVAISATVASLWLVGPNILDTWRQLNAGIAQVRTIYMLTFRPEEVGFDHSLFAVYKRFFHVSQTQMSHTLTAYLAVMAISGTLLYFLKIRRLPLINQVLCLCIASVLMTPISFDYTLIYLYVPWAMLVLFAQGAWQAHRPMRQAVPGLAAAFICMAVIMSPQSEFIWHSAHFGGQIKALVLTLLLWIGLKYPFTPDSMERSRTAATYNPSFFTSSL
jgi:Glycosyltransferase family 87